MRIPTLYGSFARRFHAQCADTIAGRLIAQRFQERPHGGPVAARFDQQEIVMLGRDRQKRSPYMRATGSMATPQSARLCATAAATALCERG